MQDDDGDEDIREIGMDAEVLLLVHRVAVLVTAICAYRRDGTGKPLDPSACDNINECGRYTGRHTGIHASDEACADEIAILSSWWSEIGGLTSSLLARI
ncbi:hypothetical protein HGRIS_001710 [Hohenbuehelia grisea]|uniref:Uncharacterized protein n=1 Tax=Hohenbuehelia grisea TaxID=104357 RepID=A0ABR3JI87_9AGAR